MEFVIIIVIVLIIYIVVKFSIDLNKDKHELKSTPIEEKFRVMVKILNDNYFDGKGGIEKVDARSFNLYQDHSNRIILFQYSTGELTLTLRYKYYEKEIVYKKGFNSVRNLSLFEQQNMANEFVRNANRKISSHKNNVMTEANKSDWEVEDFDINKEPDGNDLQSLDFKSNENSINCEDGFYLHEYRGESIHGEYIEYDSYLVFATDKYVQYVTGKPEEFSLNLYRYEMLKNELIKALDDDHIDESEILCENIGTYIINDDTIEILLFDPNHRSNKNQDEPNLYLKLKGSIKEDSLVLDLFKRSFDYDLSAFKENKIEALSNAVYKFYDLKK